MAESRELKNNIVMYAKSTHDLKEVHDFAISDLAAEFRKRMSSVSELGGHEVNIIQNENYALNREVHRLLNEKQVIEKEIQNALIKLSRLEATVGIKQTILEFSNSSL